MSEINGKNILGWQGGFADCPYSVEVNDDGPISYINPGAPAYLDIDVLDNDDITYPVREVEIISYNGTGATPKWTGTHIRIFKPTAFVGTAILQYQVTDLLGRKSNVASVYINFITRALGWRPYQPSAVCQVTSTGQNTGLKNFAQRERYYTDNNAPVLPQLLEANDPGPNYQAGVNDPAVCPPASQLYTSLRIASLASYMVLTSVTFKRTGYPDYVLTVNVAYPGSGSAVGPTIPIIYTNALWDDIIIGYNQLVTNISAKQYTLTYQPSGPAYTINFPAGAIGAQTLSLGNGVVSIDGLSLLLRA